MKNLFWMIGLSLISLTANADLFRIGCGTNAYDAFGAASTQKTADFALTVQTKTALQEPVLRRMSSGPFNLMNRVTKVQIQTKGSNLDVQIMTTGGKYTFDINGCSKVEGAEGLMKYQSIVVRAGRASLGAPIVSRCTCRSSK